VVAAQQEHRLAAVSAKQRIGEEGANLGIVDLQGHEVEHTLAAKGAAIHVVAQEEILVGGDRTGLVNHVQHVIELAVQIAKHCRQARGLVRMLASQRGKKPT
jgi:hypothetical protein